MDKTKGNPLEKQLILECDAMAKHALANGLRISPKTMAMFDLLDMGDQVPSTQKPSLGKGKKKDNGETSTNTGLLRSEGKTRIHHLAILHDNLSRIVAPATPRTILLMYHESLKKSWWHRLGPVPLVRNMMLVAAIFLVAWIGISLSDQVDGTMDWANEHGLKLLLEELFILFAAGIGATFTILFQVNRFVINGTYDPKYDSTYWTRLVLGIVAGMILAFLIPLDSTGTLKEMTKPTLAMLGGFSVTVVHRILVRIVAAIESLVRGEARDMLAAREQMFKAKAEESKITARVKMASELMKLKNQLGEVQDKKVLLAGLDRLIGNVLPEGISEEGE